MLRAGVCGRLAREFASQETQLSRSAATTRSSRRCMQKERPQSIKVRPRSAIERAPSLGAAVRVTGARGLTIGPWDFGRICRRIRSHAYRAWRACVPRAAAAMAPHRARCVELAAWPRVPVRAHRVGGGANRLRPMLAGSETTKTAAPRGVALWPLRRCAGLVCPGLGWPRRSLPGR